MEKKLRRPKKELTQESEMKVKKAVCYIKTDPLPEEGEYSIHFIPSGFKKIWLEEFNLKAHSEKMKLLHPWWTERQCRNLLYWQGTIRKRLKRKTYEQVESSGDIVLEIPEACGVNVFETMALVGVQIDRHPDIVRKVMMLGRRR